MEFLKTIYRRLRNQLKTSKKTLSPDIQLKPYEKYFYFFQDLITWEAPSKTLLFVFLVNIFFWCLKHFEFRPYGIFFSFVFFLVIHKLWTEHVWPEIRVPKPTSKEEDEENLSPSKDLLRLPQLHHFANCVRAAVSEQIAWLINLRSTQPMTFCMVVCGVCCITAGIGSVISGFTLLYLVVMGCLLLPGVYKHVLSSKIKAKLHERTQTLLCFLHPPEGCINVDDYLPEPSEENLVLLAQAGENLNDIPTLAIEDSSIMALHDESSMESTDAFSLGVPIKEESDSDSELDPLPLKSHHFNDSSTDEETKLLDNTAEFPEVGEVSQSILLSQGLLTSALYQTLPTMVGRLHFLGMARNPPTSSVLLPDSQDDSDSEFEIINKDDVPKV